MWGLGFACDDLSLWNEIRHQLEQTPARPPARNAASAVNTVPHILMHRPPFSPQTSQPKTSAPHIPPQPLPPHKHRANDAPRPSQPRPRLLPPPPQEPGPWEPPINAPPSTDSSRGTAPGTPTPPSPPPCGQKGMTSERRDRRRGVRCRYLWVERRWLRLSWAYRPAGKRRGSAAENPPRGF